jgi:hypothetical protein
MQKHLAQSIGWNLFPMLFQNWGTIILRWRLSKDSTKVLEDLRENTSLNVKT